MLRDGNARGPIGPASLPRTPHHLRRGAALDNLIRSIEAKWQIGLRVRGAEWSPNKISSNDLADKIYGQIKRLFYSAEPALTQAIASFSELAPEFPPHERLDLLYRTLSSKTRKNHKELVSRTGTPRNDSPKSLKAAFVVSKDAPSADVSRDEYQHEPDSYYTTAHESDSTTEEDEDGFATPPSPTPSSRAASMRTKAGEIYHSRRTPQKRPSELSSDCKNSPKLTKISKEEQIAAPLGIGNMDAPNLFKKPSLNMMKSFHAAASAMSSANTSFANTASSSQETTTTVNTSFTSNDGANDTRERKPTRTSSISMDSADDHDPINAMIHSKRRAFEQEKQKKLNRIFLQNLSPESGSNFGLIDEDGLYNVSRQIEEETNLISASKPAFQPEDWLTPSSPLHDNPAVKVGKASMMTLVPPLSLSKETSPLEKLPLPPRSDSTSAVLGNFKTEHRRPITPTEFPSRVSHHIRDIPKQNMFVDKIPQVLSHIPYFILFICQRIAIEAFISLEILVQHPGVDLVCGNSDTFWEWISKHPNPRVKLQKMHDPSHIWQAAKRQFQGYTFKGRISYNPKGSGPVFCLQLLPIQADKSCRLQRKFGSDRFLYLTAPVFDAKKSNRFNTTEMNQIQHEFNQWLKEPIHFNGRIWRVFHVEPQKRRKSNRKATTHDKRVVLFAVAGWGIETPYSIGQMLDWFLPFHINENQSFCKAYARIDLGLSRTVPTIVFKPSQLIRVPDVLSNGERENTSFDDPNLEWDAVPKNQVMNDGCSIMSVGAAREIWRLYKDAMGLDKRQPLPSTFQGRISGAKGLWMISGESFSRDPKDTSIWIQVSDSQLKFQPHNEDLSDDTFDPLRLTFEVSNHSSAPSPSELHISFIPIIIDRWVLRETVADFMTECLDAERSNLVEVLKEPVKLYDWIYRSGSRFGKGGEVSWQASLPVQLEDKLKFLLESGFTPMKFPLLANYVERFITAQHIFRESSLRTPLGKSTYLFGIADPLGILKPGEVHVQFSASFVDEKTQDSYLNLRSLDILVARQPACRRSDIQKVCAVAYPELSHLIDVVVFPSRGEYPLAGKLQGGDYDGDMFWLCWESRLVEPFKNAPAPVQALDPRSYDIKVEKRKVKDIMDTTKIEEVDQFLQKAFEFRTNISLLGRATVFHEKQSYRENRVFSNTLHALCGLHDLLVDAPKQGYIFTWGDFDRYIKTTLSIDELPKVPAYKVAMEDCAHQMEIGDIEKLRQKEYRYNTNQVLDYLYFEVVRSHNVETIRRVKETFSQVPGPDEDLLYPYIHLEEKGNAIINDELRFLRERVAQIYYRWASGFKRSTSVEHNNILVDKCHREYKDLEPNRRDHPDIKPWLERYTNSKSSPWDRIKASALYARYPRTEKANFVFKMAGRELANLKARGVPNSRRIVPSIHAIMRPKRIKAPIEYEEEDDESDREFGTSLEHVPT